MGKIPLLLVASYLPLAVVPQTELANGQGIPPREFGFDIPPGKISYPAGQAVLTRDPDGNRVVAQVHVRVGKNYVLLFPDGQLAVQSVANTIDTDQPFVAVGKESLVAQLLVDLPRTEVPWKTRTTRRYLFVYNTNTEFALVTSRILETMFPGIRKFSEKLKTTIHDPVVPMVVIMFGTEREFRAFRSVARGVHAYYEPVSNRIVLYQQKHKPSLKPQLAIQQSISTIAHEGAHQILHNIGVQQRLSRWPMWLSEGLAEYFAPTSVGKRLRWKGLGQVNDLRMFELEQFLKSQESDRRGGEMIEQTVAANRLSSTGYASAWSLTHFLAQRRKPQFQAFLHAVSQLKPLQGNPNPGNRENTVENLSVFQTHFGDDLIKLENELIQHLKRLPYQDPYAEFPHLVGMIVYRDGRQLRRVANLFHTQDVASKWTTETLQALPEPQRASARHALRSFPNRNSAERFAKQWLKAR